MEEKIKNSSLLKHANICIDCQRAVGGCSWSEVDENTGKIKFQPVEGSVFEDVTTYVRGTKKTTKRMVSCPLFVPDEKRESSNGQLGLDQVHMLKIYWKNKGEL
jgi:hypothetical protein